MLSALLKKLDDLDERDEDFFVELEYDEIKHLSDLAALFQLRPRYFPPHWARNPERFTVWIPYSQLRELDGVVYASTWIMEQKDLKI